MPNAFQAWDLEAKAAVMSGLGTNALRPISPNAGGTSEGFSMTSVMDGQPVHVFLKWKKMHVECCNFMNPFVSSFST